MDFNDDLRPRFTPKINGRPCRFSVGAYRGKTRITLAWFADELDAIEYLRRCRLVHPYIKYDLLKSLF